MKTRRRRGIPDLQECNGRLERVLKIAETATLSPSLPHEIMEALPYTEFESYWQRHHGVLHRSLFKRYSANCRRIVALAQHHKEHSAHTEDDSAEEQAEFYERRASESEEAEEIVLPEELYAQLDERLESLDAAPYYLVYFLDSGIGHVQGFNDHRSVRLFAEQHRDYGESGVLEVDDDGSASLLSLESFVRIHRLRFR
jgi:hypothetical protein